MKRQYSRKAIFDRLKKSGMKYLKFAEELPGRAITVMERFSRNQLKVGIEVDGLEKLTQSIHHASRQISYTVLIASTILASSVLVLASGRKGHSVLEWIGFIGFLASFVLVFLILVENFLRRNR